MSRFVTLGEIMLRLNTPSHLRFCQAMPGTLETHFGGAEASVAALLANWGESASFVTALPDQALGHACVSNLRSLGVNLEHTVLTDEGRMGLYFVEHGVDHRPGQVIYDRADSSFSLTSPDEYDWAGIFSGADWLVMTGITPAISRNGYEVAKRALKEASGRGVRIACDMNFRNKLWRWDSGKEPRELAGAVMRELVASVDLLVCGRGDATQTLGMEAAGSDLDLLRHVAEQFSNLKMIVCTRRQAVNSSHQSIAASIFEPGREFYGEAPGLNKTYEIQTVVDRVGTGDAMLAALLFALESDRWSDAQSALELAVATGCLAHSIVGDISYLALEEAVALAEGGASGRLIR